MQQCRDTKRQETVKGLRWATRFLLIVMLSLQTTLRVTEAAKHLKQTEGQEGVQSSIQPMKNIRLARDTVLLLTESEPERKVDPTLNANGSYIWKIYNSGTRFKLEYNRNLVVPKKGLYFVNLKMYYYIPTDYNCEKKLFLKTSIEQYHTFYPKWRDVIKGIDTMQCEKQWYQSVTLSQVARFEKGTKLRVLIDPSYYKLIIRDSRTFFSVTRL